MFPYTSDTPSYNPGYLSIIPLNWAIIVSFNWNESVPLKWLKNWNSQQSSQYSFSVLLRFIRIPRRRSSPTLGEAPQAPRAQRATTLLTHAAREHPAAAAGTQAGSYQPILRPNSKTRLLYSVGHTSYILFRSHGPKLYSSRRWWGLKQLNCLNIPKLEKNDPKQARENDDVRKTFWISILWFLFLGAFLLWASFRGWNSRDSCQSEWRKEGRKEKMFSRVDWGLVLSVWSASGG